MLSSKVQLHEINYSSVKSNSSKSKSISKTESTDIGQVKIYLGFAYFIVLAFFSVLLLN